MASIPLPALHLNPPQEQPNPIAQMGQVMQLKALMQNQPVQSQILQQQQQEGALDVQQKQQQVADQKAMTAAMQQWDGKDYNDLVPLVTKNGGSAQAVLGLKAKIQEQQVQASTIAKNQGEAGVAQLTAAKGKGDEIAGALAPFADPKQIPDEQVVPKLQSAIQDLQQRQLLDPAHAQAAAQLLQSSGGDPTTIRNGVDQFRKTFLAQSQIADEAAKAATAQKDVAQGAEATANTNRINTEMASGGTQAMADARFRNLTQQKLQGQPISAADQAWMGAYKQQKTLVPVANFNLQNSLPGGGAPGGAGGGQPSALAQAVASGAMKWGDVISPRTPMSVKAQFAAEVHAINPSFDTSTYGIEQKAAEKATSGSWADTRVAYNTAMDHSQLLLQAAAALQNNDVRTLNTLKNKFATEFGSSGPIDFNAIANAYNHEVGAVISKGHITDKEVETQGATLPANANLATIQKVVGSYNALMLSKRNELDKMIKATAGNKANGVLGVGSDSGGGNSLSVTAPNGKVYTFKDQASADAFKQKAGIQ